MTGVGYGTEPRAVDAHNGAAVLVAGVGNIFLGDDGFGPEVVRQLAAQPDLHRPWVRIVDYGIRGIHLAYDLLDGAGVLILVDAVPASGGDRPGTLRVLRIQPENLVAPPEHAALDGHALDPLTVLEHLRRLGGTMPTTYLIGCVPGDTQERIGLSGPVTAAIPDALAAIRSLAGQHAPAGLLKS